MKKCNLIAAMVLALVLSLAVNVNANENKVGVGYQGIFLGDTLQGVSVRGWLLMNKLGLEGNIFQGTNEIDIDVNGYSNDYGTSLDADLTLFTAKAMFAPIVRQNSKFYVGLEAGVGTIEVSDLEDIDITIFGPLLGAEYNFQEAPELGFNWEVGYKFTSLEYGADYVDVAVDLDGVSVSLGVHYFF